MAADVPAAQRAEYSYKAYAVFEDDATGLPRAVQVTKWQKLPSGISFRHEPGTLLDPLVAPPAPFNFSPAGGTTPVQIQCSYIQFGPTGAVEQPGTTGGLRPCCFRRIQSRCNQRDTHGSGQHRTTSAGRTRSRSLHWSDYIRNPMNFFSSILPNAFRKNAAFSMIEIVIALGVISFALVAVIGLLPVGLRASRESIEETRAAAVAQSILETVPSQPFNAASFSSLGSSVLPVDLAGTPAPVQLYANYNGQFVSGVDYFSILVSFRNTPEGLVAGSANEVARPDNCSRGRHETSRLCLNCWSALI